MVVCAKGAVGGATNVIVGGVMMHLVLGTLYSWGCIQPYVTSYLRLFNPSVTATDSEKIYAASTLGHAVVMPLVGVLQYTLGLRGCAAVGCGLASVATLLASLATSVGGFSVLSLIFGVGIAFAYTCPLVCGYGWMPGRKGTVSGFIVAGFGAGAAVFNIVATATVNPHNVSPDPSTGFYDEEIAGRVPGMYRVLGTCYLVLGMLGSWMLSSPPASADFTLGPSDSPMALLTTRRCAANVSSSSSMVPNECVGSNDDEPSPDSDLAPSSVGKLHTKPFSPTAAVEGDSTSGNPSLVSTVGSVQTGQTRGASVIGTEDDGDSCGMGGESKQPFAYHIVRGPPECVLLDELCEDKNAAALDEVCVQGDEELSEVARRGDGTRPELCSWSLLTRWDYYRLSLSLLLTAVTGLFVVGNYKHIAQQRFPDDDRFLSIMGSFASLSNASGRILGGLSVDRFGCFETLLAIAALTTGLFLTYNAAESKGSFFALICLLHFLYGSNFSIYPTLTAELFGASTAGPDYGLVFMAYGIGSSVFLMFLARINGSNHIFLVCAFISFLGIVSVYCHWTCWRRSHRQNATII